MGTMLYRTLDGRVLRLRTDERGHLIQRIEPREECTAEITESDRLRFWSKVDRKAPNECWPWLGAGSNKYGTIRIKGRMWRVNRVAYYLANGTLERQLVVDHTCRNPTCANPAHLRQVTAAVNTQSMVAGRGRSGIRNVHPRNGRWYVSVRRAGRIYHGGVFDSLEEADAAARSLRACLFDPGFEERVR